MTRPDAIARVNVLKVVLGAFVVIWWNRRAFAQALAIPLVTLTVLSNYTLFGVGELPEWAMWLLYFVHVAVFTLFAVTCHRLVLLDRRTVAPTWLPPWTWRESRFLFYFFAVWFLAAIAVMVPTTLLINLALSSWTGKWSASLPDWLHWVPMIPMMYVFARFCLVFPATAVDRKVNIGWSWIHTRKNGWRLFAVVSILPWVISQVLGFLYFGEPHAWETIVLTFLGFVLLAVEVAALSLSYRELTQSETKEQS